MRTLAAAVLMVALPAFAQKVSLSGSLGDKALLVIDGTPRTVAAGSSVNGVKLLSVSGGDAVVEVQGKRVKLALGGAQVNLGGKPTEGSGSQIVLTAGSGGHFFANGSINGKAVRFVVDTGATYVSMGAAEAERLGIDFRRGERGMTQTANGTMAAYKVMLASVRIGDVQVYNVEALVGQSGMDQILLGNSFLTRFQMKRENDLMTLNRRY
ncbi:TIGR02281 family clan AA aspartic protease [Rhizobacter sp. Root404]|uniref:retropepsin-like aspartic protease family protein n=1 Tax=Rhizobacter sp. Root404 TaxID=1736528 RepID=UPI000AA596EB|nr:TIGR02281 family clan AA aspartic protease [Rhizobacter sp. Root404]